MSANRRVMTKCHIFLLSLLVLLSTACDRGQKGQSLSEYAQASPAVQKMRFEEFAASLHSVPLDEAFRMQEKLLDEAAADTARWRMVLGFEDSYIYDPNSPLRSEELYIPVLEKIIASPLTDESERSRAEWRLQRCLLNRIGEKPADFTFVNKNGRSATLYGTIESRKPELTILFFSNPGCPMCADITKSFSEDPFLQEMVAKGRLLIINIYPDEDLEAWYEHLSDYPAEWITGRDPDGALHSDTIYYLRAIPSLYLLDTDKTLLLKDAPPEVVMSICKRRL